MIEVSVRNLCEFAARSGSLEFRYTPAPSADEGIIGHLTVQQRRPDPYVAEYRLTGECEGIAISGRVDGYYANPDKCYLEEIKTHRGNINRIGPGRRALHWAQLKVYGALLCMRDKRDNIDLRLTYFEVRDEQETQDTQTFEAASLTQFLTILCDRYRHWAESETGHRHARDEALTALRFPYPDFRTGQRALSENVYKAARRDTPLLLQAPTGIGKTVGVLFPALKAMPASDLDRVFFLSNRNTGRQLGLDGLRSILDHQDTTVPLRFVELSAKEASCDHPDKACHGDSCPLANGFFDRLSAARQQATQTRCLDQTTLRRIAAEHDICRYFLAQEMARWSDIVVGDVNHYFDQFALLYSLAQQHLWRVMPVVDEAHNLIDRARGMYSMELSEAELLYTVRKVPAPLLKPLSELETAWAALIRPYLEDSEFELHHQYYLDEVPEALNSALYSVIAAITDYLTDHPAAADVQQVLFTALAFLRLADSFADHSLCTLSFETVSGSLQAKPGSGKLCIDNLIPADHLRPRFDAAACTVLFSATLSPPQYHQDLLGLPADTVFKDVESPFSREQIDLRLITSINTRQQQRQHSLAPICDRIVQQMTAIPGNYLVYVSSFDYLNALFEYLREHAPTLRLLRQRPGMPPTERDSFITEAGDATPSVGFAVLGGVFGEGIDLPGERLIGVFVATLGLPPHNDLYEVLRQRLEARYGRGYDYTYLYPGIQKVVQAAGRLIRTEEDRGVIELIDDRFSRPAVRALLPKWWGLR